MFKKVLIVDDHAVVNTGVFKVLEDLGVTYIDCVQYCEEAVFRVREAIAAKDPYELLITDLSFKEETTCKELCSGEDLVADLRRDIVDINIIVYSMDDRLQRIRKLMYRYHVGAYVSKGRRGGYELSCAIECVAQNKTYLSPQIEEALRSNANMEIDDFDVDLVKHLSYGLSQIDISKLFAERSIIPHSLSAIEKRISNLKDMFKARNTIHLIAISKDLGLI